MNTLRPVSALHHLRFRWAFSHKFRSDMKTAALLAGILIAYGIVGRLDYEDALISEARASASRAEINAATLAACLNGGMAGLYTEDDKGIRKYVVCDRAWEVSDENIPKGRT